VSNLLDTGSPDECHKPNSWNQLRHAIHCPSLVIGRRWMRRGNSLVVALTSDSNGVNDMTDYSLTIFFQAITIFKRVERSAASTSEPAIADPPPTGSTSCL